jgi:TolC family type I secretion outer membrane protein
MGYEPHFGSKAGGKRKLVHFRHCVLLGATICLQISPESSAMPLEEALARAYNMNPQLLAERAQLRATDEEVNQAVAGWRPTVQISGQGGYSQDIATGGTAGQDQFYSNQAPHASVGANITQALFNSHIGDSTDQAMNEVRAERSHLDDIEQQIFLKVITDYVDLVRDEAKLDLEVNNEQVLSERLASDKARFNGGELSRADVAETEAAYQQATAERAVAESNVSISRLNFVRDVGEAPGKVEYPTMTVPLPSDPDEISKIAATQNPAVRSAEFTLDSAENAIDLAIDQALPQVALVGSYQHAEGASFRGEHENTESAMLRLTMPIYSGGTTESQTRAARETAEVRRNQLENTRANVVATAFSSAEQLQAAQRSMVAYSAQIKANEVSLRGVQYQELAGERTILDVLNVQQTLLEAQVNYVSARHDYIVAQYTLAEALGRLTVDNILPHTTPYDKTKHLKEIRGKWFGFGRAP